MTHKKKSVSSALLRSAALVITPVIAAWVLPGLHNRSVKADAEPVSFSQAEYNVSDSGIKSVLNEGLILSEGYGVTPETADDKTDTDLISPLDMTAENAGEKPYPTEWGGGGSIIRTTYGIYSGNTYFDLEKCGQVNNKTDIPNETLLNESRCLPNFTIKDTDEPQVLIYHTHTTESFEPFVRDEYDAGFNYRTTDPTKNVVMVGDAIQAELEAQGIGVIHVRTIHDYPSYNGSYARSRETIVPILEQYPDIKVALDIHRDAVAGDGVSYQPYIEADGREAAQVMIISGCDDGTLGMPEYMKNFHFACSLQQKMESDHPGLTRPILFDYRHYNQDLTTGSLLIEVGSHCNTLDQVQYAGQLVGRSLAELLLSIKEK
ncbi:MAG: stage II sporulation protein P [Ruminococcus sp.]|nr:stage II sporulation protein P [Ruminococcus sp.]